MSYVAVGYGAGYGIQVTAPAPVAATKPTGYATEQYARQVATQMKTSGGLYITFYTRMKSETGLSDSQLSAIWDAVYVAPKTTTVVAKPTTSTTAQIGGAIKTGASILSSVTSLFGSKPAAAPAPQPGVYSVTPAKSSLPIVPIAIGGGLLLILLLRKRG